MKGSIYKRCGCTDPATGKRLNRSCPRLSGRHGAWTYDLYVPTPGNPQYRLKRGGFGTKTAAEEAMDAVGDLLKLAKDNDRLRARIGEMIVERTKRGGQLPDADEVRRRLGAGGEVEHNDMTVAEWLEKWLASKRKLKRRTAEAYRQHLDHYLIPLLGDLPRDGLKPEHITDMFDTIDEWNAEIVQAAEEDREPYLPDDVRKRHKVVGVATQRRIYATLRNAYNTAVRLPESTTWNPCLAVEMPEERRDPARVWGREEVAAFLDGTLADPLHLLFRLVLLRGPRRGEVCGLRWKYVHLDRGYAEIREALLVNGGKPFVDHPKSAAGERVLALDNHTCGNLRAHQLKQRKQFEEQGLEWSEEAYVWTRPDGLPYSPGYVTHKFRKLQIALGLPVIKLHEGRHTAATLGLEAGVDIKVVSEQLGHSTVAITLDTYTHVRLVKAAEAAKDVERFVSSA